MGLYNVAAPRNMFKWFPWKWLIRHAARTYGIFDPFMFMARLRRFAEPSEVDAPLELIRAGAVFQARGVVNARAIQHNLDWIWPYWVERQFNPRDPSFIPRAFSFAHINLTHRNWTAVCLPHHDRYALVDPRGLVTPLYDGWSIDAWVLSEGSVLIPGRCDETRQVMHCRGELAVETVCMAEEGELISRAEMREPEDGSPELVLTYGLRASSPCKLAVALRPYNPEGVQFIDTVEGLDRDAGWLVNDETRVSFSKPPESYHSSTYESGDVFHKLRDGPGERSASCPVGMATAAALFPADPGEDLQVRVTIPMRDATDDLSTRRSARRAKTTWQELDSRVPGLEIPDGRFTYLYHAAVKTLQSLSSGEVYPGVFTYRRFWFRDACLMLNALLSINHEETCRRSFEGSFPRRQTLLGFFESQQGEWDSNGQVLWLAARYMEVSGQSLPREYLDMLRKGAEWICRKRIPRDSNKPNPGLLPPGFSAEHLGPNNYYYWDNFWALAGLRAAARVFSGHDAEFAARMTSVSDEYEACIQASIRAAADRRAGAIPAAPGRRMDAGAVGSLAADYPLKLFVPGDERIMKTVEYLLKHCMIDNGFFHDMTHSGINAYLSLHIAQVLIRAGDQRFIPIVERVAAWASPSGQWPEAIHPRTGGGCMGDGQHGWAAAEWVLMIRHLFLREEGDRLVVGAGLFGSWLESGESLFFGPTATRFGPVCVRITPGKAGPHVAVIGSWHESAPPVDARLINVPARDVEVYTED